MTACYTAHQVFTSVALGAEYVAPYLGRMMDNNIDALQEASKMQRIVSGLKSSTRVFAASIRDTSQLVDLAQEGCHTFTFAPSIADGLLSHPLTSAAAEEFDWSVRESMKHSAT